MIADPQPMPADPHTDDREGIGTGNGRSATAPAEGAEDPGTPRDPAPPDD